MKTMTNYYRTTNTVFQLFVITIIVLTPIFSGGQDAIGGTSESKLTNIIDSPHHNRSLTIQRTKHGVAHINASNYHDIGYGVGYVYTQDNQCLLAHRIAEVNGRLSEQLGADAPVRSEVHDITYTALQSDHYYRGWFDIDAIRTGFLDGATEVREMAQGYADGVNRFLADHPLANSCEVTFTGKVTIDDIYRMWVATATVSSGEVVAGLLPHAAPTAQLAITKQTLQSRNIQLVSKASISPKPFGTRLTSVGSNAWAIGREGTRHGKSIHLYNPHFPWSGIQRLYMIHVTIPGELDVMGVTLGGFPIPLAGFTKNVAWGLTFSPAARWSLADLKLEGDPMTYKVNGSTHKITAETLSIPVLGESTPREIQFFRAKEGPLIDADPFFFGWWDDPNNPGRAYAAHDVNADNTRIVEQFLRIAQAKNVRELNQQLKEIQGVPWSYVVASDADGEVFFGDVSAVPGLSTADITQCVVSAVGAFHLPHGIIVLDGTRKECTWNERMAAEDQPQVIRSDYLANSNNTFELPNVEERLTGYSPILGNEGEALSLRASLGLHMITDRLSGDDGFGKPGFTRKLARKVFHQIRNRGAELLVDGIVDDCQANPSGEYNGRTIDLSKVCLALAHWDRTNRTKSRGAVVFRGLWMALSDARVPHTALFQSPALLDEPLNSPSGYTTDQLTRTSVRNALAKVAVTLIEKGISPDVRWGKVNKVKTPSGVFPMPGGFESEGIFDSIVSSDAFYTFDGWSNTLDGNNSDNLYGASYLHVVQLGKKRPRASGLLPYSQATEPTSPWYLDQVKRWSKNRWFKFPFTRNQIASDPDLTVQKLNIPCQVSDHKKCHK